MYMVHSLVHSLPKSWCSYICRKTINLTLSVVDSVPIAVTFKLKEKKSFESNTEVRVSCKFVIQSFIVNASKYTDFMSFVPAQDRFH